MRVAAGRFGGQGGGGSRSRLPWTEHRTKLEECAMRAIAIHGIGHGRRNSSSGSRIGARSSPPGSGGHRDAGASDREWAPPGMRRSRPNTGLNAGPERAAVRCLRRDAALVKARGGGRRGPEERERVAGTPGGGAGLEAADGAVGERDTAEGSEAATHPLRGLADGPQAKGSQPSRFRNAHARGGRRDIVVRSTAGKRPRPRVPRRRGGSTRPRRRRSRPRPGLRSPGPRPRRAGRGCRSPPRPSSRDR